MEVRYRISVIIPTYNREKTIIRCLDSIFKQTYPVYEVIVVDDGSTDETLNIIKNQYSDDVRIIKQRHKGAQAARNVGVIAAKGEYIAFLDSDDEWLPKKLELQIQELARNKDAVVCGDAYIQMDWENSIPLVYRSMGEEKRTIKAGTRRILRMNGQSGNVYKLILKKSFCMFQGMLTAKKNIIDAGMLDENVPSFQEWDLAIRLAEKFEFLYIKQPIFIYHLHDGDTISKDAKSDIDGREYICEKYKYEIMSQWGSEELTNRYKELMRKCMLNKDKRFFSYFFKFLVGKMHLFILK
ncbi:MAG: glycosyltransferase family 2 protein [Ruminococcus flavefaciens]|nr:glycosyltransferase family 2 protein [Ruminococcus flavefaciens]